jgi:peptide/nickel transport system ATP-binding protein
MTELSSAPVALLSVTDLHVNFTSRWPQEPNIDVLRGVSFQLHRGERVALVGESGAGKSLLATSIIQLFDTSARIRHGSVEFEGQDLTQLKPKQLRQVRGRRIGMVFQDPMTNLNPSLTLEQQLLQCILSHRKISRAEARLVALHKLRQVHIPAPETRMRQYPHQLSAGQLQRVTIAMALALEPALIIADEPTSALDVTMQAEIISLLTHLCHNNGVTLLLISHDLSLVAHASDRCLIMYAGQIVEQGQTKSLINDAQHPYTQNLIRALPQMSQPGKTLYQIPGQMPLGHELGTQCAFANRCQHAFEDCWTQQPVTSITHDREVSCHLLNPATVAIQSAESEP